MTIHCDMYCIYILVVYQWRSFPGYVFLASTTTSREACIAQDHAEMKALSIRLLDNFIAKCDSMCVLFTWTYLERLWCVWLGRGFFCFESRIDILKKIDKAWQNRGFAIRFIKMFVAAESDLRAFCVLPNPRYEWACVLVHKPTEKVHLQTELFVKEDQTLGGDAGREPRR